MLMNVIFFEIWLSGELKKKKKKTILLLCNLKFTILSFVIKPKLFLKSCFALITRKLKKKKT